MGSRILIGKITVFGSLQWDGVVRYFARLSRQQQAMLPLIAQDTA
ncbi:MAG: hypothetical protein O7F12_06395 [Nitrospirae bacterium]|nr:hypothetical protein [Nitrospirota bacterium]